MNNKEMQDTVELHTSIAVGVYFCEADFETKEEWKAFLDTLTRAKAKELLLDNLDLDDIKDSVAQTKVYIREYETER